MFQIGKVTLISCVFSVIVSLFVLSIAVAQESTEAERSSDMASEEDIIELEEQVVVGSRARPRSVINSAVPIDVLNSDEFVKQGGSDLPDLLRNVVPSYNVNLQPISDAATVVRPPNLRGLAPDHALVLVNGKRRHRASVIYWLGNGIADAAQGPDISAIPAIALKRVEVLRDGASAQYGSDAIAGVMNFQLKDNYQGGSIEIKPGIFQEGDGFTHAFAGNIGLGREDHWANLSLEYGNTDETDRSVQRADASALIGAGNIDVANPAQPWGQPIIRDDLKLFANYGAAINDNITLYGHANYASKQVEGGFYFRNPNTRGAVFSNDGGETLLVGRLAGEGDVPVITVTDNVPDSVALRQVIEDQNLFTFQEKFPGGFTPRFGADTRDLAFLAGLKGNVMETALTWDASASYGRHHSDFFIFNTVNASLGPDTPTHFNPGDYIQADTNLNLDFTYPVMDLLFLAAGIEYRTEAFEVVKGQIESYQIGPLASQGFSAGSNGFPGFGNIAAGTWDRSNMAGYVEAEVTPIDSWLLALALRGEDFEDFGTTLNYKVATNFGITEFMGLEGNVPNLKVRGGYSTGFRAPTPGQQNAFNVTTEFGTDDDGNFILVNKGTIPSTHPAAALVGGKGLEPEKSKNFTVGTVIDSDMFSITADYFNITVEDRLTTTSDKELTSQQVDQLEATGINAKNLQQFRFLTNDFSTKTQGIDLVLTVPIELGQVVGLGTSALSVAYNWTGTEVTDYNADLLGEQRITQLERGLPRHRGNLSLFQNLTDNWSALGRINYYGSWDEWPFGDAPTVFGSAVLVDLESSFSFDSQSTITVGVNNVLNVEPDDIIEGPDLGPDIGRSFGEYSPYGFGGTFWYAKYNYNF